MATIPIEVIVQDAEAPVVPSEDGTNNTETNITVPDTGTIGSSGDTSSSASSIILPAILLVLAIGSIVAILIHKYHKQKKDKTTRKEKLAMAVTSTIAVLAATVLVSNIVLPATKAATSDVADGIVPAEDKVSIVVTRDGGSAETSVESNATITSTSDFGYKVLLSMAEGVETGNLYLNGDTTSQYYIASVEAENEEGVELADNTWGYTLTEGGEYSAISPLDNAIVVAQGSEPVEDELLSIYYGVKVSSDLPAGTYSGGEMEYSLVSLEPTISTLTYMQDFAKLSESGKASVLRSMTEDEQYYLKDNRDDKSYRIAKLKDGKVWMTQNLDLEKEDLLPNVILDSSNTDGPINDFVLPDSQTGGTGSWSPADTAHVYDIAENGQTYYNCIELGQTGGCGAYDTSEPIPSAELGNYYNWYTAAAGTGTSSLSSGEVATGSICPAGWRLPSGALNSDTATDYSSLLYSYGILAEPTGGNYNSDELDKMFAAPLYFVRAGGYDRWAGITSVGFSGSIFLSMYFGYVGGDKSATAFDFHYYSVAPWGANALTSGYSVRCMAR